MCGKLSGNSKRVTIKLDLEDHKKIKVQSAKDGIFLKEKVENLIEDYVFDEVELKPDNFKMKQKNIKLVKKVYDKIKERIEEDSQKKDRDKKRNRTLTNVAKGLIEKFILNRSGFDFRNANKAIISFYQDTYNRKDPKKNKTVSLNVNKKIASEIESKVNKRRDPKELNSFQRRMEILLYAYAENKVELEDSYFEKKNLSIRLDYELYNKFTDSLCRHGSKLTIQKVGESLIKRSLNES